ncbi:MAG: hypothetical protein HQM04_11470 [Magnetococcales bacterium]|nr:hypothetical protein [Magnetococcales bacterium]MBF0115643.1 hypothetical protein [Magnetococcales bacterium]
MDKNGNGKWTAKMVAARMEEAVRTLRLLRISGLKPRGYVSSWPDVVIDLADASGQDEVKLRLDPPTPEAITRMDEALRWLCWLEPDQARLVWMHAEGVPRKTICAKVGMSRAKAWRSWAAALMTIASAINVGKARRPDGNEEDLFLREYRRTGNASAAYKLAFQCDGLTSDAIQARARRLMRKYHGDGQLSRHLSKTVAKRRFVSVEPSQNDGLQ